MGFNRQENRYGFKGKKPKEELMMDQEIGPFLFLAIWIFGNGN
jgi:hypothetical protein